MKQRVGFIGIGVMGRSMARHILNAGHVVTVFNRSVAKAQELIDAGATWADSPKEVAKQCDVVITIVGYPRDVEEVYFGADGLIKNAKPGSVLIDMTTSTPKLAQKIHEASAARGVAALDAPVSGGDIGAREARLTIMVGGDQPAFDRALPIFQLMGKTITLMGGAGAGQHTKMCNQIAIAAGMMGVCEALVYAEEAGLDRTKMIETISTGAAASWSLVNYGPRIIAENFAPGFYVKHFIKDMEIALDAASEMGVETPGLQLALDLYSELASEGHADDGTHALYKLYSDAES
ncbi:MAG TPA: NAD(P)-dependent oxidoreductase [Longimicrobiales bacterium]|nr:NAD(P)-dependent oxidoreductase [Longimicrobiales bacterium]